MELGMFTACMPERSLAEVAEWASAQGFAAVEVAMWPRDYAGPFTASHIDAATLDDEGAGQITALIDRYGLRISSLGYYVNLLGPDEPVREAAHEYLRRCIEAAARLGVPSVGTFVGRHPGRTVRENIADAERLLPPLTAYAADLGVKLIVENCVMEGWHPDGYPGNLAYSPELWEWVTSLGFGLNWDPSHLVWIGVDPIATIGPWAEHIVHVQAKDIELDPARRQRYGVFGPTWERKDSWDNGWWRYRVPGLGDLDWARIIDRLSEFGYEGVISVEHEDPIWTGSPDRVEKGLRIARRTLAPLLAD
jgi:sugar phosphate isomerase/epimerase